MFSNDDIVFCDIDSDIVTFFSEDIGLNRINLNNAKLDDENLDDCDSEIISHVKLMGWSNKYKQQKACKKGKKRN